MTEEHVAFGSRYETLFPLASGGMATVYLGTARGAYGFRRVVAIKKPLARLTADPTYRQALIREARLASLIHHANVVDVRDVEVTGDEVSLIMDYVEGATLGELVEARSGVDVPSGRARLPPGVAVRIVLDACAGLHAAHEQADERDRPLHLIHRDISPQNLLVGADGLTRVADFGVAKFKRSVDPSTAVGILKGKLSYMAPEYVLGEAIDRRVDVFAMGVVLWEILTGHRLFRGGDDLDTLERVLSHAVPAVSTFVPALGTGFDAIVETALARSPDQRFQTASAMAAALESSARTAGVAVGHRDVADLVKSAVGPKLEERRALVRARLATEPSVASVAFEGRDASTLPEGRAPEVQKAPVVFPEEIPISIVTAVDEAPVLLEVRSRSQVPAPVAPAGTLVMPLVTPAAPAAPAPPTTLAIETLRSNTRWPPRDDGALAPLGSGSSKHALGFVVVALAVVGTDLVVVRLRASSADTSSAAAPSASAVATSSQESAPVPAPSASTRASATTKAAAAAPRRKPQAAPAATSAPAAPSVAPAASTSTPTTPTPASSDTGY